MSKKNIPLSIPNFMGNEKKYVDEAVEQGWVSTGGAFIKEFENKLGTYLNTEGVAACQSGTSALHLSLISAGVKERDVVLVSPLTFIAAVNPIKYLLAEPVFIDCDDSLCIDPQKVKEFCENKCTFIDGALFFNDKHVKAIVVVHVFGNMADMESLNSIAKQYNLKIVEDATEALGTKYITGQYSGKYAGTIGDYGAYSFNGNKIITTGGGGAVTAKSSQTVDHLRYLSTQAKDDPKFYVHNEVGFNYRMTNIQAALGVAQMEELEDFVRIKNRNYNSYCACFKDFKYAEILPFREGIESNRWFYSLLVNIDVMDASLRDIIYSLEEEGIQTRAIWGLINEQNPYKECETYKLDKAPYYAARIINLPCSTSLKEDEVEYVSEIVMNVLGRYAS